MKTKDISQRIAISIDFSHGFGRNGLTQNILFLMECINSIPGKKCYLLFLGEFTENKFLNKELCISYENYIKRKIINFNVIIYAGFAPRKEDHDFDKSSNKSTKYVLLQLGNELTDDIQNTLNGKDRLVNSISDLSVDQIWTSPHYERNISYLKTKYKNDNIKICPYLWAPNFINRQLVELDKNLKLNFFKKNIEINKVCIFEPNIYFTKTSLIPLNIIERFEQNNPNLIESCCVFNGDILAQNKYFISLIISMNIYKKRQGFLKCLGRVPFLKAINEYGGLVVSHQFNNELNYVYFETLYLSLPLIHNSDTLSDYGYFYNDCDIDRGADWIRYILNNHKSDIDKYDKNNLNLFKRYSPFSQPNIDAYKCLLEEI